MISPLKPILTFFGVKDGKIEATALKRIADSLNNLINTYVAWADTVGQDYSISNFIKWLKNSQGEIVATELRMYALKAVTLALNMVFAMFASWAISAGMNAFINWMKNAKTHSEQLISTMEDAHDAAEEAQQDVDDIQQKLDDLDQQIKDLGAEKIEDIVDPQEKAKIQEINNLLETQLRLKKQIADDENNKANKAASDVFNDKSEVVTSNETPTSYAEADPNGIGVTVTPSKNVTRTEALREHTARVNELSDAYVKLMSDENATDEERAQAKKNLEDEISLTNDAGTKVSELADMYETDASKYGDVSAEVQECTDSMQGASDALERANNLLNGTTSVENTNLDAFKSKFKDVIEEIDNGYLSMQEAIAQYKELSPLQAFGSMTGEAIINIDSDTAHQTEAEATALAKLHEIADANNISFEDLISAFEQLGIVATSDTSGIANYATQLEETMKAIDSLQSSYKSCSSAVEEYNKYGYLSTDTMQSLLQMDTEYLNCLDLKDGKLQLNKQRYAELLAAQYAQAEMEAIEQAITELNTIAKEDSAEKTESLTTATEEEKDKLVALCPALKDATVGTGELAAALAAAQGAAEGGNADEVQAKIDSVMNALNTKLTLLHDNMSAAINNGNALSNQLGGFSNSTKSASKSVSDAASAFDTLSKAMKEYNQYGYICADTMKSLAGLEDKYTSCLTKQNGKLVLNTAQFRKFIKAQLEEANAADDGGKSAGELNKILDWLNSSVNSETISFEQLTDAIKGYGTAMDEAKEKTDAIKSAFSGLYEIQQKIKNSQFGVGDLDATESKIESILQLSKFFGDNKELMDNLVDENGNINLNTEAFKQATIAELDKRIKAANETGGAAATALANSLSSDKANIESGKISVSDYLVGLGTDLERVNTELDKYQANWGTLKDAMDEWNSTGQLTQDTMQKLQELPEEFSNLLTYDEDGNAKIDVKALRQSYVDKLSAFAKEFEGSPIGIQVQAMIDDVREPTPEEYEALAKKTAKYQKALAEYTKKINAIESNDNLSEDEYIQQKEEADAELNEALQESLKDVQETDAQVTRKLKEHWDGVEKVIEEFKSALSDAKDILSSFLSLLSSANDKSNNDLKIWGDTMNKVIDKRIEALNKQKEALEENNEATERAIELSKAQDALARAQQQRTTRVYTENGYEWQANAEDVRTAREDLADKQREWNKKDAEKAIDDQIKKYNEFKDKLSEVMDDIGKSWKDYQKELEYTAQIQNMSLSQMEGSLDSYHNKIIASLNTGSAITSIQNLITNLESLINTLTKVNNLYSMFKTGEYKDQGLSGLWNTVKGFFGKGKSENVNKSFKDTFDAAKKAFNAGKKQLTDTATTGASEFINATINQIKTSGNTLIDTFGGIWDSIKLGAQNLFHGSGEGGGVVSTVVNGFKAIGNAVSKTKIGSTILGGLGNIGSAIVSGGGKLLAGASGLIKGAGAALAAAGPAAIPILAAGGLGIYGATKNFKHQKEIWSNKEDSFGKKAIKSVASFFWDTSPIGAVVNLCKDIFGKSKETAENTKDTANSSSETAENTKKATGITNLTINATQGTISEENKTEEKKQSAWDKFWGSKFWFWNWGKKASGDKKIKHSGTYNVDEVGPEMLVRQPASGRYTYLETGDGVVPADITSRLFEMGGNPDKWFSDQLAKNDSASMVQSRSSGGISLSIGDVNVNNPVGDSDALARELVNRLPNKVVQELNRR